MARLLLLIVLLIQSVASPAYAQDPFEFKELLACDEEHQPYGPDKLIAERIDDRVVVTGWAGLACGERVVRPQILPDWASLTLRVETDSGDEPVAACRCTGKFQFTISRKVSAGDFIYLVKNGAGTAHVVAP